MKALINDESEKIDLGLTIKSEGVIFKDKVPVLFDNKIIGFATYSHLDQGKLYADLSINPIFHKLVEKLTGEKLLKYNGGFKIIKIKDEVAEKSELCEVALQDISLYQDKSDLTCRNYC